MEGSESRRLTEIRGCEPLDDSHRTAAAWAGKRLRRCLCVSRAFWHRRVQSCAANRQQSSAFTARQKPGKPDPHKAFREDVNEEPAQELMGIKRHLSFLVAVSVILPSERDLPVAESQQPVTGYRYTVSVAGQILQHMLGSAEWLLRVNDPLIAIE